MAAPRLLVFDLDGTLIDSSIDLCNSVNAALEHVGKAILPHAQIASFIGDGAATLVLRALEHDGGPDALSRAEGEEYFRRCYEFFLHYYRAHKLDHTRCYDGIIAALTAIRKSHPGLPMAILTNKPVNPSREICDALGLSPFFFQNYGGNSFGSKKPDPEGLLALIAEASSLVGDRIMPCDTAMVGDSDVDVLTARACGAISIGCSFGLAPEALEMTRPNVIVDHPSQWQTALGL